MRMQHKSLILIQTALCTGLLGTHATAQNAAQATNPLLEELVVTARKREQNLQDVAIGVSLLSGKAIAESQLRNATDLSTLIPALNVQASSGPATTSFNIRGIGTQTFSPGIEPSVSTMLDNVVMGRSGMAFIDLVDIERVEVLRGPQGTLYGKNASGGVVHIITRDPTPELSGTVTATAIEDDEYRFGGTVSGPITDTLSYRLTGSAIDDDGYAVNVYDGKNINSAESFTLRGKVLWQPSEDLEFLWSSDYSESECECTHLSVRSILESPRQDDLLAQLLPVVPSEDNQRINEDQETFNENNASGHSLTMNWSLESHEFTSITSIRSWKNDSLVDFDHLPINPIALSFPAPFRTKQNQFSQEFRLASTPADWGSYVVGAFYFDQDIEGTSIIVTSLLVPTAPATTRASHTDVSGKNTSLFGEVSINVAENWELTLGGRYTYDDIAFDTLVVGTDNFVFPEDGAASNSLDESDFSPKVALQWQVNDTAMLYASYVSGYKGPAFDTSLVAGEEFVQPETSDAWEAGLKSTLLDGRLILNIAAFYADYTDFQAEAFIDENTEDQLPGNFRVINAGKINTRGVEIDFISRPTDNWSLSGGMAFTDGTIEDFPGGNCSAGQKFRGECPGGFQDLAGGDLPQTPKWKMSLITDYTIAIDSAPFDVVLGANFRVQDDVLYGISQDEYTVQESYGIVDLRTTLVGKEHLYRITAFVKNVFDENYAGIIYSQARELIPNSYIHGVPKYAQRTAGIELRYDF